MGGGQFIAETRETLDALSGEIVAWEADPGDDARLDAIFRFVHTVKGSCGFLDLPRLARLSHAAEDVLAAVRRGERFPDRQLVNAVLAVVDRIGEIVEAIDAGNPLDDSAEESLIAGLAVGSQEVAQLSLAGPQRAPARSVRLNVDLLDRMMSGMSDMVLARNELARCLRDGQIDPQIEAALERMSVTVTDLRNTVTRTRMQKIDALFSALPRIVRDTAADLGKSVNLHVEGADVELDRELIEVLRDPLVHIVRNSIDHGIEWPDERRATGKREQGKLSVSAWQSGNQIVVEVADDGRGIDVARLIDKLVGAGRDAGALRGLDERSKLHLVFEPGLSSKDVVTEISGRGVGMDVVHTAIEQIGGRIELDNEPGRGLRIRIHVPLTLSIIPTIIVMAGGQRYAIPRQTIEEIISEHNGAIRVERMGNADVVAVRDRRLSLVTLTDRLEVSPVPQSRTMLVIVNIGEGSFALRVEDVLDNEELVIKPAAPAVMATGLYAGQTLPDNGCPMLVLDCAGIARDAGLQFARAKVQVGEEAKDAGEADRTAALVFVDLDGVRRAVPLALVDRVEQVDAGAIRHSAGRSRLTIGGRIVPFAARGVGGFGRMVLRLRDGERELAYSITEAAEIALLPTNMAPAPWPGPVAGVVLLDDEPVELLDPYWLFGEHCDEALQSASRPLCLLSGGDLHWLRQFIQPMIEAVGYRVTDALGSGERADLVLALDAEPGDIGVQAPVVHLSSRRGAIGNGSIYRFDRGGLLRALVNAAQGGE